ncbi:MAG: S1/P1 nuclease [Steroidobacteraceae bacterium]
MWQASTMTPITRVSLPIAMKLLWLALLLPMSQSAHAWGNVGHRVTGLIASGMLTPKTRQQVQQLLGEETLATATTDMDTQRTSLRERWPTSDQWHYDNQPVCGAAHSYCADGNCATRQIEHFRGVLASKRTSQAERALALRLLIHMLGDIHQPLHMGDNADRGGNNLYVRLYAGGERYRLHELLDTVLLKDIMAGQRVENYAAQLQQRYKNKLREWQKGELREWAQQTHELATTHTYGLLPGFACRTDNTQTITLSAAYVQDARNYLPEQLTKAGARIAAVLNATLN